MQTQRDIATAKQRSGTARWRQSQRKPDRLATSGPLPVARGKRRKTEAEEMYLSMEVVPDRRTARSSRIASHSALGATSVCGPLRRDPQAGTSRRRDRHDSGSMNGSKNETRHPPQSLWRRETAGCSNIHLRVSGGRGTEKTPAGVRQGPRRERTRHECSRLKQ